jgi:hypothetical protein
VTWVSVAPFGHITPTIYNVLSRCCSICTHYTNNIQYIESYQHHLDTWHQRYTIYWVNVAPFGHITPTIYNVLTQCCSIWTHYTNDIQYIESVLLHLDTLHQRYTIYWVSVILSQCCSIWTHYTNDIQYIESVLLVFLVFFVVLYLICCCFFCIRPVSCVPNVTSVSGFFSIFYCPFDCPENFLLTIGERTVP